MNCEVCGTELPYGAMFCGECGRAVGARATESRHPDSGMPVPQPLNRGSQAPFVGGQRDTVILEPLTVAEHSHPVQEVLPVGAEPGVAAEPFVTGPVLAAEPDDSEPLAAQPETESEVEQDLPPEVVEEDVAAEARVVQPVEPAAQIAVAERVAAEEPAAPVGDVASSWLPAADPPLLAERPDPFPWGDRGSAIFLDSDELEQTLITARRDLGERFVLQFSTGESVTVFGTGLLGRNPVPQPGEYFDQLVPLSDPGKSVSKTHLEFGQEAGAFWVSDRYSGNGSVVREPDTAPRRLVAGRRYRIVRGSRVDIGEQFFVVS